eukprot:CAMPEP_0170840236 /NCGR_PEP_ID=MMETSP0734-20130129/4447_1 /TAXON_ID=186038 /ORGANISM="Fragilariopsis kerguelensis, Strain L26-C5" /LENGTH=126 /DNA_ID=CAMNT_0011207985 /DNA_START=55 /DNA_END=433 /DNA_ORIENTATION=+
MHGFHAHACGVVKVNMNSKTNDPKSVATLLDDDDAATTSLESRLSPQCSRVRGGLLSLSGAGRRKRAHGVGGHPGVLSLDRGVVCDAVISILLQKKRRKKKKKRKRSRLYASQLFSLQTKTKGKQW